MYILSIESAFLMSSNFLFIFNTNTNTHGGEKEKKRKPKKSWEKPREYPNSRALPWDLQRGWKFGCRYGGLGTTARHGVGVPRWAVAVGEMISAALSIWLLACDMKRREHWKVRWGEKDSMRRGNWIKEGRRWHTENVVALVISAAQVKILFWTAHLPLLDVRVKPGPCLYSALYHRVGTDHTDHWRWQ